MDGCSVSCTDNGATQFGFSSSQNFPVFMLKDGCDSDFLLTYVKSHGFHHFIAQALVCARLQHFLRRWWGGGGGGDGRMRAQQQFLGLFDLLVFFVWFLFVICTDRYVLCLL